MIPIGQIKRTNFDLTQKCNSNLTSIYRLRLCDGEIIRITDDSEIDRVRPVAIYSKVH